MIFSEPILTIAILNTCAWNMNAQKIVSMVCTYGRLLPSCSLVFYLLSYSIDLARHVYRVPKIVALVSKEQT
jgi:hypothetical protein